MTSGRSFDRLVGFTDAVVAVAITLLGLSLVDIRAEDGEQTVWQIFSAHASELFTFAFTFAVVAAMWQVHNRIFNRMRGYDGIIFRLNVLWLFAIALLPWPSALYGEGIGVGSTRFSGGEGYGGAGMFYWGTLAFISLTTALMVGHLSRRPELIDPDCTDRERHPWRSTVYAAVFLGLGLISLVAPLIGSWLALVLIPLELLFTHLEARRERDARSDGVAAERWGE